MIYYNFRIHVGNDMQTFTEKELGKFASLVGLDQVAPGRLSWLFVMQLFLHAQVDGVDPSMIVAEIKALEGGPQTIGTKTATEFTKEPLKGLWHKHFFSAHFVVHNLINQLAGGRLKALVEKVLDPKKHPIITAELINELSHEVATGTFEKREAQDKLTGGFNIRESVRPVLCCPSVASAQAVHHRRQEGTGIVCPHLKFAGPLTAVLGTVPSLGK